MPSSDWSSVLSACGSFSIEPVEQVGKIVSVIKIEVDLGYIVHQRRPARDRIENCPRVATWHFFHRIAHRRIKSSKSKIGKLRIRSALPSADIRREGFYVRFVPTTDISHLVWNERGGLTLAAVRY